MNTPRYPYIVAWGRWLAFSSEYVREQVEQAIADNAPHNAIQKHADGWHTLDDIQNANNRAAVEAIASRLNP